MNQNIIEQIDSEFKFIHDRIDATNQLLFVIATNAKFSNKGIDNLQKYFDDIESLEKSTEMLDSILKL